MASYPSSPAYRTDIKPISRVNARVTSSGNVRGSNLEAQTAYRITVTHPYITTSDIATLRAFRSLYVFADNTIVGNDGETYDCWYETDYEIIEHSAVFYTATCTLLANIQ